jgi:hypothetical protein
MGVLPLNDLPMFDGGEGGIRTRVPKHSAAQLDRAGAAMLNLGGRI